MSSDRNQQSDLEQIDAKNREIAALKKTIDLLSRQAYGRVMPGLYALSSDAEAVSVDADIPRSRDAVPDKAGGALHESATSYHVIEPVSVPPGFPADEVTLELPPAKSGGMSVISYETADAISPADLRSSAFSSKSRSYISITFVRSVSKHTLLSHIFRIFAIAQSKKSVFFLFLCLS